MKIKILLCLVLAWIIPAFGDEIHEAAKNGDLEKVKALLKGNPDLVFRNCSVNTVAMNKNERQDRGWKRSSMRLACAFSWVLGYA